MKRILTWLGVAVLLLVVGVIAWGWAPDIPARTLRAEYRSPASRFVDLGDGLSVHVVDEGPRDAPVLLLLHGSNASLHTWQPWVDRLTATHRVIRYDQPGHGLTGPHPRRDYDAAAFVSVVDRLMTALGVDRFVIVGNSMGGWVALNYVQAHPGRVRGLVLGDASGAPDAAPNRLPIGFRLARTPGISTLMRRVTPRVIVERSVQQSFADPAKVDAAMVDRYWRLLRYPGNRAATADRSATPRTVATPQAMRALTMPTLLIWGAEDTLTPVAGGRWFDAHIPDSRLIVYEGVGHIPQEEAPDRSAADLLNWLNALSPLSRPRNI